MLEQQRVGWARDLYCAASRVTPRPPYARSREKCERTSDVATRSATGAEEEPNSVTEPIVRANAPNMPAIPLEGSCRRDLKAVFSHRV